MPNSDIPRGIDRTIPDALAVGGILVIVDDPAIEECVTHK